MPLILLTNDDGVHASGLRALEPVLAPLGDLHVIAPSTQQSATSHKVTLDQPLRVRRLDHQRMAVTGTPVDAVYLAIHRLLPNKPDLIVSGINHGLNVGSDVFYSGTVAAALEGALKGIPAMAVSQELPLRAGDGARDLLEQLFANTAKFAAGVAERMLAQPPRGVAININGPAQLTSDYCWTSVGERVYSGEVIERVDPRGGRYYWFGGAVCDPDGPQGTDSRAIRDGQLSISPVAPDWNTPRPKATDEWSQSFDGFVQATKTPA